MTREEIEQKAKIAYQQRFLELTGYKVGDVVEARFTHYWGGGKNVHYDWKRGKGTIIRLENGEIRIKSLDKYGKSEEVSDCPDGSLRRSHWHVFNDIVIEKIDNIILNG